MKKLSFVILCLVAMTISTRVSAQGKWGADSAECIKYMSYYKEYYKQKSYDDATPNWRKAYKLCPVTASQNMLIDGTTLVRRLIQQNAKNPVYKAALVDTLLTLHDLRAQYYPKYAVTALNNKGLDMSNYIKDDAKKLYEGYNGIISSNKDQTRPTIFLFDLQAAVDLYQAGVIGADEVINAYQNNMTYLDSINPKNDADAEQVKNVKNDMGSIFATSKVASCESLIELYTPRLEADPTNVQLASSIVKTMSITDECTNNELFTKAVTVMYNAEPSASTAYFLYRLNAAQSNYNDAVKFLEEAISREDSDAKTDADYSYELAAYCFKNGNNAKAYEAALNAIKFDENVAGKAYFLIGTIWGATRCGGNEITSRAPYWAAVDYLNKAKAADPSLAEEANKSISKFSAYFPETADAFMYNLQKGQSYTVSCGGMTASTTVKTR